MKKIIIAFFALIFFATNVFSSNLCPGEVMIIETYADENHIVFEYDDVMRIGSNEGRGMVDFYYDEDEAVVEVNVVPNPSDVLVYIVNLDTDEAAYDIAPAGSARLDIAISGSTGRYEVFYYAFGDVPAGFASVGSAGQFIVF